ncbi:MAG: type II secretion system protein [Candidatus Contendobacter sp.]|nr:type II secretion system protein [Candidatus Contendobacter sp.]
MSRPDGACGRRQGGLVLLWLLFLVAGLGVSLAALGTMWHTAAQRQKEAELLFVGDQYRRAIESFWKTSPQGQERLPRSLRELLEDPRFPHTIRHLRRLYADPMTGTAEWGLLKSADGGIAGVFSLSRARPLKTGGFPERYRDFANLDSVAEWVFAPADVSAGATRARTVARTDAASDLAGDAQAGGRPDAADASPGSRSVPMHPARVAACQVEMENQFRNCARAAQGDAGRLHACTDAMTDRHRACLDGR